MVVAILESLRTRKCAFTGLTSEKDSSFCTGQRHVPKTTRVAPVKPNPASVIGSPLEPLCSDSATCPSTAKSLAVVAGPSGVATVSMASSGSVAKNGTVATMVVSFSTVKVNAFGK